MDDYEDTPRAYCAGQMLCYSLPHRGLTEHEAQHFAAQFMNAAMHYRAAEVERLRSELEEARKTIQQRDARISHDAEAFLRELPMPEPTAFDSRTAGRYHESARFCLSVEVDAALRAYGAAAFAAGMEAAARVCESLSVGADGKECADAIRAAKP